MSAPQPAARCWFCETVLSDTDARILPPVGTLAHHAGTIIGPCCADLAEDTDWVLAE